MLSTNSFSRNTRKRDNRLLWLSLSFLGAGIFVWLLNSSYFSKTSQEEISRYWRENSYEAYKSFSDGLSNTYCSLASLWGVNIHSTQTAQIQAVSDFQPANTFGTTLPNYPTLSPTNTVAWQQTMQSIAVLNKQLASTPNDPACHNRLGILYAQIGDFSSAAKQFNQAVNLCRQQLQAKAAQANSVQINKTSTVKIAELVPVERSTIYVQLSCAHSNLARIYDKLGDHDRVITELQELNSDIAFAGDSARLTARTQTAISSGSAPQEIVGNGIKLTPAEAAGFARAEAFRQVGRLPEAQQEYIKLINANPNLAIAHQRLGLIAITNNNLWLAITELQNAAKLDTKDPDTENDLGLILEQIGDYKAAQQAFSAAHQIDPQHLSASVNLANLVANAGNFNSGIAIMRQATADHPLSATAYNNLAALIARTDNQPEAAKLFSKAINLNPDLPSAHYGLGLTLLKLKSYPSAIKEFQTAMTLNPGILDLQNKIDFAYRCNLRSLAYTQMPIH